MRQLAELRLLLSLGSLWGSDEREDEPCHGKSQAFRPFVDTKIISAKECTERQGKVPEALKLWVRSAISAH